MINAYDMLTGVQFVMILVLFTYTCFFQRDRWCSISTFIIPYILLFVWNVIVISYFTEFLFLSVLWLLLGFFIGLGVIFYFRSRLPAMEYCPEHLAVKVPSLRIAPLCLSLFTCLAVGLQQGVYYYPFVVHSWIFNELLGFIPGIFLGLIWGQMISMLFLAQLTRIKVYNKMVNEDSRR